jgi:predicted transcriptional regulator
LTTETQLDAWKAIQPKIGKRQKEIYALIKASISGMTLFEIQRRLNLPINSISGRVSELKTMGLIAESSLVRINPTSGRSATVWVAK